jgi:hypothetical protein
MTIEDLKAKQILTQGALRHATSFANENPSSREAKAIEQTLMFRLAVITHEIAKQESLATVARRA